MGTHGRGFSRVKDPIAMPFSVPKPKSYANPHPNYPYPKEPLGVGERCLVCFETDPARYANCTSTGCYPTPEGTEYVKPSGFSRPQPLVSAFELAARMRAKALTLDWDADELRERLLRRARELQTGEQSEVPNEDF